MLSIEIPILTDKIDKEFGELNFSQLNWKPSENQWSIGQCIDHLIVSNGKYLPILKEIEKGKHRLTLWEKYNPFTNYTGKQMINTLGNNLHKKYKAPKLFIPSNSKINLNIITDFKKQQNELFELFQKLETKKYSQIIVTSPVASLITITLHDLIKLIIVHEKRHINQAIIVKNIDSFPSNNSCM